MDKEKEDNGPSGKKDTKGREGGKRRRRRRMDERVMIRKRRRGIEDGGGLRARDTGDETKEVRRSSRR